MKLSNHGKNTLEIEVLNISINGIWLLVNDCEYFLPYKNFPWFKKASLKEIHNVKLLTPNHLYWSDLDVDLEVDSLFNPNQFPLIYR